MQTGEGSEVMLASAIVSWTSQDKGIHLFKLFKCETCDENFCI